MVQERSRSRSLASEQGLAYWEETRRSTGVKTVILNKTRSLTARSENMVDWIDGDFVTPNPCYHDLVTRTGGVANGEYRSQTTLYTYFRKYENFPVYRLEASGPGDFPATEHFPSLGSMSLEASARSSPLEPSVNIPVAIFELRELPRLMYSLLGSRTMQAYFKDVRSAWSVKRPPSPQTGRRKKPSNQVSNSIAEYEFGIMPLLNDIVGLFSTPKFVDDRIHRLSRGKNSTLVEHRAVHDYTFNSFVGRYWFNTGERLVVDADLYRTYRESARATIKWTLKAGPKPFSDQNMREYVRLRALGLSPEQLVHNLWQALPWSWLIDWFSDFGNSLAASAAWGTWNSDVTISKWKIVEDEYRVVPGYSPSWVKVTNGRMTRKRWIRHVHVPPSAELVRLGPPKISVRQLLILLGIANNLRGSRGSTPWKT